MLQSKNDKETQEHIQDISSALLLRTSILVGAGLFFPLNQACLPQILED